MLTQKDLHEYCFYDPETGIFVARQYACNNRYKPGRELGSACHGSDSEYLGFKVNGKMYGVHRLAWLYVHGVLPDSVDHKNCNTRDNRISNLRPAGIKLNAFNKRKSVSNTSGVKGVSWRAERGKWEAVVYVNRKRRYRKLFDSLDEAKQAVTIARTELHGEFANHG
jgi:hypothetical protein